MIEKLKFKPIKQKGDHLCLTIYPPKTFMDNKNYMYMVGGSGATYVNTLKAAKEGLLKKAVDDCDYYINKAQEKIDLYQKERNKLLKRGLIQIK